MHEKLAALARKGDLMKRLICAMAVALTFVTAANPRQILWSLCLSACMT